MSVFLEKQFAECIRFPNDIDLLTDWLVAYQSETGDDTLDDLVEVDYDGDYPSLCSGTLIVKVSFKIWKFPHNCMSSGGSVSFDDDWNEDVTTGEWSIYDWPNDIPIGLYNLIEEKVNDEIPHGCCGGCV